MSNMNVKIEMLPRYNQNSHASFTFEDGFSIKKQITSQGATNIDRINRLYEESIKDWYYHKYGDDWKVKYDEEYSSDQKA